MTLLRVYRAGMDATRARVEAEIASAPTTDPELLAHLAHRLLDEAKTRAEKRSHGPPPACVVGCSSCCHVHVDVTSPELFAIARYLERTLSPGALTTLRQRLALHVARVAPLSDEARWAARVPCALLDSSGRCSVYPVRPLRCRAFHSCSADTCRSAFEGRHDVEPDTNPSISRATDAVEAGYDRALEKRGESAAGVRLERALSEHLERKCNA